MEASTSHAVLAPFVPLFAPIYPGCATLPRLKTIPATPRQANAVRLSVTVGYLADQWLNVPQSSLVLEWVWVG